MASAKSPTTPTGLTGNALNCTSVRLSWNASTENGGTVTGYKIYRNNVFVQQVSGTSCTNSGLTGATTYSYQVSALDASSNESPLSTSLNVTTLSCPDTTPPTVPANLTASAPSCSQVTLSWAASSDPTVSGQTNSGVKGYNVYQGGTLLKFVTGTSTSDTTVAGNSSYSYRVSALDNAGNESGLATAVPVTTPGCADTTSPTLPANLTVSAGNCSQVTVSWAASTDPTVGGQTNSGVKGYNVYRDGAYLTFVTGTNATDSSVAGATSYGYQVNSMDNAGNLSVLTTPVTVVTPACVASNVRLSRSGDMASLQWSGTPGCLYQAECSLGLTGPWLNVDAPNTNFGVESFAPPSLSAIYRVALFTNTPNYLANVVVNQNDKAAPTTPLGLTAVSNLLSQVSLSWLASVDQGTLVGGTFYTSGLNGYLIYRNNIFLKQVDALTTSTLDISASMSSSYTIAAIDNAGNVSAPSTPVNPSAVCTYLLSSNSVSYDADGGSSSFGVSAGNTCPWTATTTDGWVHPTGAGPGNGTVSYNVDANSDTSSRSGTITLDSQTFTITQAGITCSYSLSSNSDSYSSAGGSGSFSVIAPSACPWYPATTSGWLHPTGVGPGNGTINYSVDANSDTNLRSGTITVDNQTFTVNQAGVTCSYSLSSNSVNYGTAGGSGSFSVIAPGACPWSAATTSGWLHPTGAGPGNGTVSYSVDANSDTNLRSGTITLDSQTFTVNQAGVNCSYSLSSNSVTYGSSGGSGSFSVIAPGACPWSAATTYSWLHPTGAGPGNGSVSYSVDANSATNLRSGTITLDSQTFTVNQAGVNCSYSLSSNSASFGPASGSRSFSVIAPGACPWTAGSAYSWIHPTGAGPGNGPVSYSVDANPSSSSRSGTITLDSKTFTVTQSGHTAPTANAGPYQTNGIGATFTFNGAGSTASDGATIASFNWAFGDSTTGTGNPDTHAYSAAGTNTVTLTVTDSFGATSSGTTKAAVTNAVPPPTVPAGLATNGISCTNVSLTWNASSDPGGPGLAGYKVYKNGSFWLQESGIGLTDNTLTPSSTYVYAVSAVDTAGRESASNTISVTTPICCTYALSSNSASIGPAGGSRSFSVTAGSTCGWSASTAYSWIHPTGSGPGNGTVNYTVDTNPGAGSRSGTITLDSQTFTVTQSGHTAPTANPGPNFSIGVGRTNTFNGSGTAYDGASISSYSWNFGDGATATGASAPHAYSSVGTNTVTLTVSDSFGATGSGTATVTVTNSAGSMPLSVTLTNPANGATVSSTITLGATASTNTTRVEFYCDGTNMPLGSVTALPYSTNCDTTQLPNGNHNLYCKAYDAVGNSTNSPSVTVTVNNISTVPGAFNWVQTFGGSVFQDTIYAKAVAVDKRDNSVVIMGDYAGAATIAGTSLPSALRGAYLAKFSSSGSLSWVKYFLGTNAQIWTGSLAVDPSGNIVIAGAFTASVDFGGGPLTSSGWSLQTPNTDIFVAKFSPSGSHQWSKNFGGYQQNDTGIVTVDGSGNVLLSGYFSGTADFGGGPMTSVGYTDIFVAKLSPTGGYVWARQYGSSASRDSVISIAADSAGNVIIGGNFNNTLDFGVGALNSASGSQDMFIAKLSSAGTPIWARRCGGASNDSLNQVAVDGSGNVAITGAGFGTFDFNGSNAVSLAASPSQAIFAMLDSNGNFLWEKVFNEIPYGEAGQGVTFDSAGNVIFTGYTLSYILDFGGNLSQQDGTPDVFIVKYSGTGNWQWGKRLTASAGFSGTDKGYGITVDASNNVLATGIFGGQGTSLDFGGGNITTGSASAYGFVLKLGP